MDALPTKDAEPRERERERERKKERKRKNRTEQNSAVQNGRAHTLYTLTDATINVSLHLLVLLSYYSVHI